MEIIGASFTVVVAAIMLYLSSPHQKLVLRELPQRTFFIVGLILIVVSLVLFVQFFGSATSVFIVLTVLMLLWSIPPLLIAYVRAKRSES